MHLNKTSQTIPRLITICEKNRTKRIKRISPRKLAIDIVVLNWHTHVSKSSRTTYMHLPYSLFTRKPGVGYSNGSINTFRNE